MKSKFYKLKFNSGSAKNIDLILNLDHVVFLRPAIGGNTHKLRVSTELFDIDESVAKDLASYLMDYE